MNKHKFNHMLALVSTMALVAGSQSVYAQTADQPEEIVITGFKASLEKSLEIKRESSAIVEAVSAEDIGKLPDRSIAESLSRLPGLATQRVNGRAQIISIRGLGPDYNSTLLNGRQQVNTGDNRSVEFDQYPSEFISTAQVYKTPDATVIGQGVGGTVDLQTVKPLKYGKQALIGSATYEQNSIDALISDQSNHGNRASLSYIDQFADDTLGVALAVSHMDSPTQIQHFNSWGYPSVYWDNQTGDTTGNAQTGGVDNVLIGKVLGGAKPFVESDRVKRNSVMGTLEYTPSESFTTSLDLFYSKFKEDNVMRGVELPLQWGGGSSNGSPNAHLNPVGLIGLDGNVIARDTTAVGGIVAGGTFDNVNAVIRSDGSFRDAKVTAVGWATKFDMGDEWTGKTDISYSKADRTDEIIESYSQAGPDNLTFARTSKGYTFASSLPAGTYTDPNVVMLGNGMAWGGSFDQGNQMGYYKAPTITDELKQYRFSAEHDLELDIFSKFEIGLNYDTRSKEHGSGQEWYPDFGGPLSAPLPGNLNTVNLSFLGFPSTLGYDPRPLFSNGTYTLNDGNPQANTQAKNWTVNENVKTLFTKLDIKTELFKLPLKGNVGAQWVGTDQSSDGYNTSGANTPFAAEHDFVALPIHDGVTYNNFLPSLNLSLDVTDEDKVRFGAARTLTRDRMDKMAVTSSYSLSSDSARLQGTTLEQSPWSASAGNPHLRPWIADNVDLAYEHYFDDSLGYYSVQTFWKKLDSYVFNENILTDFTNAPHDPAFTPHFFQGYTTVPVNGKGGVIQGLEFAFSLSGEAISDSLSGFGVNFSSSYADNKIKTDQPGSRLEGLSKNVHGLTLYYEAHGVSARVTGNYRSSFLGELGAFNGQRIQAPVDSTQTVDAQLTYTFDGGSLDGMSVSLEGVNLTDEPLVTRDPTNSNLVGNYDSYGATYSLRVNYKFL